MAMDRVKRLKQFDEDVEKLPEDTPDLDTIKDLIKMFRLLCEKGTVTNEEEVERWVDKIGKRIKEALEKPKP
jgi:hypothetical protein